MRWAFVVQLGHAAALDPTLLTGRVEHVDTGRSGHFACADELIRFIEQTVTEFRTLPADDDDA